MFPRTEATLRSAEQRLWDFYHLDVTEHTVHVDSIGADVRCNITGDGPPVVLVHGTMTAGASWASLMSDLPDFRCIAIDRPGYGLSSLPKPRPASIGQHEQVADDLVAGVLDGLCIDKAHVIGTSMGGWTMFRGAAAHPDRHLCLFQLAWSMGLTATPPLSMRMPSPGFVWNRPIATPRIVRTMLKRAGMRRAVKSGGFSKAMIDWMVELIRCTPTAKNEATRGLRPATLRGGVDEVLFTPNLIRHISARTHIFWGREEIMGSPTTAREFVEALPNATLQIVPRAGHAPWLDEPALAAHAIRRHFR